MTEPQERSILEPRILFPFILITLIWSSTWIVIRDQLGVVPPTWSIAYRFIVAGAAMFALVLWRREPLRLSRSGWMIAVAMGLFQFCFNFNFVYRAEAYIASGLVAVLFALLVVPNAAMGRIFLGQKVTNAFVLGSGIAIAGVGLLFANEHRGGDSDAVALGVVLTLFGVLGASVANVIQASKTAKAQPMLTVLAWSMLIGAGIDASWALATSGPPVIDMRPGYLLGVAYLGIMGSTLTFPLYFNIIRAIGPGKAAYSSVLIPIFAMAISTVFEGYRWSGLAIAGSALALIGLVIAMRAKRAPAAPLSPE